MAELIKGEYTDVEFHNAAATTGTGKRFEVKSYKTLTVEIYGSDDNTARTVTFYGVGPSKVSRALAGTNITAAPLAEAVSTTGTGELWQFNITGLNEVIMELTAITGGIVIVKGRAVT